MLRTYLQSKRNVKGIREVTSSLVTRHGLVGLWSGTLPTLIRDVPFSAIYWTLMEKLRTTLKVYSKNSDKKYFSTTFIAGALSGMELPQNPPMGYLGSIAAMVAAPADVIKTRLQMSIDSSTVDGDVVLLLSKLTSQENQQNSYHTRNRARLMEKRRI